MVAAEKGEPPLASAISTRKVTLGMYNKPTDSYYLHYFSGNNRLKLGEPEIRQEIFDMMRFWFDKGIDGFRMDSISLIAKDPSFPLIDSKKISGYIFFLCQRASPAPLSSRDESAGIKQIRLYECWRRFGP